MSSSSSRGAPVIVESSGRTSVVELPACIVKFIAETSCVEITLVAGRVVELKKRGCGKGEGGEKEVREGWEIENEGWWMSKK